MPRRSKYPERLGEVLALYAAKNLREIAAETGIPQATVHRMLKAAEHPRRTPHRQRRALVPAWVPEHLRQRYADTCAKKGETYAATEARRLKKEEP